MDGDVRERRVITWGNGGPQCQEVRYMDFIVSRLHVRTRVRMPIFPHTPTLNDQNQSNSQQRK